MKEKQDWTALIAAYSISGQTQADFCRAHKVVLETFKGHLKRSRRACGFSQLTLAVVPPLGVELHFLDGLFLRFAGDIGTDYLRQLIEGLRS